MITGDEIWALLQKNKKRLSQEIRNSKELVGLLSKSTHTKLNEEEKEQVKIQLLDVLKTIPAFAVFMLPGGLILLPIVIKYIPEIMPSSFSEDPDEEE